MHVDHYDPDADSHQHYYCKRCDADVAQADLPTHEHPHKEDFEPYTCECQPDHEAFLEWKAGV